MALYVLLAIPENISMLGWIVMFGLIFFGSFSTLAPNLFSSHLTDAPLSLKLATIISGILLLACILTRVARGRA
jgi:hypothetical protein